MRKKFIAANWKSFPTGEMAVELSSAIRDGLSGQDEVSVVLFPPFPYLQIVSRILKGSRVLIGAQNVYPAYDGAYTGEICIKMLVDLECDYVIVGHSERRHILGETDEFINAKVRAALNAKLSVIFCVGETLSERNEERTEEVLRQQLLGGLKGISTELIPSVLIAYEPVWAIGTGKVATPEQAQESHAFIRKQFAKHFGEKTAQAIQIQYGGSVKADNAAEILKQPDVDGALVGGASLKADSFLAIVNAAR